jgi:DNA-binding transcriptional LysR family regulator
MPRTRAPLEIAAGKLISAIQREWSAEAGELSAPASEEVMHSSHTLLAAAKAGSLVSVVGSGTVSEYLGKEWVKAHPRVWPHIQVLESVALGETDA